MGRARRAILAARVAVAHLRLALGGGRAPALHLPGLVARAGDLARRGRRAVRARPLASALAAAACVAALVLAASAGWRSGRAAAQARELLSRDRAADARAVLDAALARRPGDVELLLLRGRALHRLPGRAGDGIEAYAAAAAQGPLDAEAFEDLVADLGRERSLADKATRLLRDDAERSLPVVLRAAADAPGAHRLRALALARDLGAEERVNRVAAYAGLLADSDCDVRRAAARRLGEIGDPGALPALRRAAQARVETKGFFGPKQAPACAAGDADAAARRIEAARLPGAP
jgi:serine/threonine-protein kinase